MPWILDQGGIFAWVSGITVTWLFFSSLFYAHLVTMQIYHRADQQLIDQQIARSQYGENA
jgi:hypothetical protein